MPMITGSGATLAVMRRTAPMGDGEGAGSSGRGVGPGPCAGSGPGLRVRRQGSATR
ncbi:hypothetical protein GCM10020220_070430 [Nonomuraea rubra]|uniref:hypothetical protein n=1 Tax=Nonomuraea rubra TaxID=46180 RepID=UPI0031E5F891